MKKAIFTVVVDDYNPEICRITLPTIDKYAKKIDADHILITERKFPEFPPTYEKMQVYELGKKYEHCILIDADMIVHNTAVDFSVGILPGYVGVLEAFDADNLFKSDEYFQRDGRNIGLASNFVITDKQSHKLWEPLDMTWEEARTKTKREFIIDEYCISRNMAKYNLKFTGLHFSDQVKFMFKHLGATTK